MRLLITSIFFVFFAGKAVAEESRWVEVGGNSELTVYVDNISIKRTGSKVKVWLRWENTSPVETDTVYPKRTYMSAKTLNIYDCSNRSVAGVRAIRYEEPNSSGDIVESTSTPETSVRFLELSPETIGENIMFYACKINVSSKN